MDGVGDHDQGDPAHAAPTELDSAFEGRRGYKHVAPSGACPPLGPEMPCKEQVAPAHDLPGKSHEL